MDQSFTFCVCKSLFQSQMSNYRKQFLIQFTLNFHLDQNNPHLSVERFPFGPNQDSISISVKIVKVGFWWAVERQVLAICFLKYKENFNKLLKSILVIKVHISLKKKLYGPSIFPRKCFNSRSFTSHKYSDFILSYRISVNSFCP